MYCDSQKLYVRAIKEVKEQATTMFMTNHQSIVHDISIPYNFIQIALIFYVMAVRLNISHEQML